MAPVVLPTLVIVSGPPGTGKTTLAHALARAIPCPAICRDEIKEGMAHAYGDGFAPATGDPLTQRTLLVFFDLLGVLLAAGASVVAEAAFQHERWREGLDPLLALAQVRVVQCNVEPALARERVTARLAERSRRAHADAELPETLDDWQRRFTTFQRLAISAPTIDVDTSDGYAPSLGELLDFVTAARDLAAPRANPP